MEGAFESAVSAPSEPIDAPTLRVWQHPLVVATLALIAVATATWALVGSGGLPSSGVRRFVITLPESDRLPRGAGDMLAISPDGRTMVYRASRNGQFQLFRRSLDEFESAPIPNTEGGRMLFFSPDGQWIGFEADDALLRVALAGGPAQTLTSETGAPIVRGAHWGPDDLIVYGLHRAGGALMQVPASGGPPTPLFAPDDTRRARHPHILPTGDVLFTLGGSAPDSGELRVLVRETGEHRMLLPSAAAGWFLETGHLVFVRGGALWGVPFDLGGLETIGDPVLLVEHVRVEGGGAVQVAVADNGSLVYVPGQAATVGGRQLVWVSLQGAREVLSLPERFYRDVALSPDRDRAAFTVGASLTGSDVWVSELTRSTLTPIVVNPGDDRAPIWTLDGAELVYGSLRGGRWELRSTAADGTGSQEVVAAAEEGMEFLEPTSWSANGDSLAVNMVQTETGQDVGLVTLEAGTIEPLIDGPANEVGAVISPNGRWIAYTSDQSDISEVYVQRFPDLGGLRQVSVGGGSSPIWSPEGTELFYRRGLPPDAMMSVTVSGADTTTLDFGAPEQLFDYSFFSSTTGRAFDLISDARRFLMIDGTGTAGSQERAEIHVVLNWFEELKRLVPVD